MLARANWADFARRGLGHIHTTPQLGARKGFLSLQFLYVLGLL